MPIKTTYVVHKTHLEYYIFMGVSCVTIKEEYSVTFEKPLETSVTLHPPWMLRLTPKGGT